MRRIRRSLLAGALVLAACSSDNAGPGGPVASRLSFTVQPSAATAGVVIAPAVQITAEDAGGNVVPSFTGNVTLSLGANPGGATLSGTLTVSAVAGVATFSDLRLNRSGTGYTLVASSGSLSAGTSTTITISAGPALHLGFTVQPTTVGAGATIVPAVQVSARDSLGNVATSFTGSVTVALGANPGAGTLTGTVARAASAGVATFDDLSIDKLGTGYTLTAAASGLSGSTSSAFTVAAGAVSSTQSTMAALPTGITASNGISASTITVTAKDAFGNPVVGAVVLLAASGTGNALTQPSGPTNANGVATGTLSSTAAGAKIVSATIGAVAVTETDTVTVAPAAAAALIFTTQPTGTGAAAPITPAVQVAARDAFGNFAAGFTGNVTLAIGTNPAAGTLSGTTTVAALAGVATFSDLSIDKAGVGYTLSATSGNLSSATSNAFTVSSGTQAKLAFTVQPSTDSAGKAIAPAVQVAAQDAQGNTVTSFTGTITVGIGTNPSGGTLSGTKSVAAVVGVATFANLSIDKTGAGYTLQATATGLTATTSQPFAVVAGGAAQLVFTTEPSNATAGVAITPAIEVTTRDAQGNTATGFSGSITIAIGTNPGSATLSGTAVRPATGGVATFTDLSLDKVGTGYTLSATTAGATSATSATFNIAPGSASQLIFTVQPANATGGVVIAPAINVSGEDALGNTATTFTGNVTLAIGTNPGGGTLSGTKVHAAAAGVATFNNLSIDKSGVGYTLSATATGLTGDTSTPFTISVGPAAQLAFMVQPSDAGAGASITPAVQVQVQDAGGNLVTGAANSVTLAIAANPGGGTLSGGGARSATSGVATFSTLSINKPGTGYRLRASASGLTPDTSTAFDIAPGGVSASQSQVSAATDTIGQCWVSCATGSNASTITVTVRDGLGNPISGAAVTLAVTPSPATHPPDSIRFTNPGPSGATNGSGVFTARFNSGVAVPTTIKATAAGTLITQQPVVAVMPVVLAAGDIADGGVNFGDDSTADQLDSMPGAVIALGDNAYPSGTPADFTLFYAPTWGRPRILARTHAVVGNHEYDSSATAAGHFGYFGAAKADPLSNGIGYYSFDVGAWHVVALNSEPAGTASGQLTWLQGDLAVHPNQCILAVWHEPLFTSGSSGGAAQTKRLWNALQNAGAELVMNGHDHFYERFAPQDSVGNADPTGIREIIVGTGGGEAHSNFRLPLAANDQANDMNNFSRGVIRVTLYPGSYRWEFTAAPGFGTFSDAGSGTCH